MKIRKMFILGGVAGFLVIAFAGVNFTKVLRAEISGVYPQLEKFTDCLGIIEKSYVEDVPPEKLIEGAIKGMVSVLDPHSAYLTKEGYKEMQISTTGSFGGLGIEIGVRDEVLTVITPIDGTPAFRAGVLPGRTALRSAVLTSRRPSWAAVSRAIAVRTTSSSMASSRIPWLASASISAAE